MLLDCLGALPLLSQHLVGRLVNQPPNFRKKRQHRS